MSEEQTKYLQSIIQTWFSNGAQCSSALKPYQRSLYPTYHRAHRKRISRSNRKPMIKICEDFLRKNRHLFKI